MKISFIATVFNEEENVGKLFDSLLVQSKKPDEIIVVDGGSIDQTISRIMNYELRIKNKNIKFKLLNKNGNRAVGRNEAIRNCSGDIIVCSDAGCVLDKNWIKNITQPFSNSQTDVVAGYYNGFAKNVFQKCLIPYVLVMPDKVNASSFLPASRSMAFRKSIWKKVGGFPEQFLHNEDYVFAKKLKKQKAKIVFQKDAIVHWIPRENIMEAFVMFFRFAKGDLEAKIVRIKVLLLFVRFVIGLVILIWNIKVFLLLLIIYLLFAVFKNYKYVLDLRAIFILPVLQITADIAVVLGTIAGGRIWDTKKM